MGDSSLLSARRPLRSPTVQLLFLFAAVFLGMEIGGLVGFGADWVALSLPLFARPWTLVTTVYAHGSPTHLVTNAVALVVVGLVLERFTTPLRFHAFVLGTGTLAGIAQVLVGAAVGSGAAVLGASGAVLALYGYVLAGNPVADGMLARVDLGRRGRILLLVIIVASVVVLTGGPGVALVAHAAGFGMGAVAGRLRLLQTG